MSYVVTGLLPPPLSEEEWSAKSLRAREIKAAVHARKEALAAKRAAAAPPPFDPMA